MRFSAVLLLALFVLVYSTPTAQQPLRVGLPNAPDSVKFLVMGDNGTGGAGQYAVAAQMARAHAQFPFDFAIMLGDNLYGSQKPADFVTKFETPYRPLRDAGVTFYAALGNHDAPSSRFYKPWNMNGERYYTYTQKQVRFFVLDSDRLDAPQLAWLERELQRSTDAWKVAYFHHPLYSAAGYHGPSMDARRVLEPLFVKYGVNAVFSGHDHVYERIKPQHGIYYFVSGSAGQLRRGDLRRSAQTEVGYDRDMAFMLVEIDADVMSIEAISRGGSTVDAATLPRQTTR